MICRSPKCGLEHPGWVSCSKAKADASRLQEPVLTAPEPVLTEPDPVLTATKHVLTDRHKAGYMRDYMKARREKKRCDQVGKT